MNSGMVDPTAIEQGITDEAFYARPFRLPGEDVIFNYLPLDRVMCDVCSEARPLRQCEGPSLEIPHGKRKAVATLWLLCASCEPAATAQDLEALTERVAVKAARLGFAPDVATFRRIAEKQLSNMALETMEWFDAGFVDYGFGRRGDLEPGSLGEPPDSDAHAFFSKVGVTQLHRARAEFRSRYGFSVPTIAALETIVRHASNGLVDFGTGNGYWSYLLRKRGLDVRAVDQRPVANGGNRYYREEYEGISTAAWTDITQGSFDELRGTQRTLFLSWPPPNDMALLAARRFPGDTLIYVGERSGGVTGGEAFHRLLADAWTPVGAPLKLPTLYGCYDDLRVFTRR